MKIVKSLVTTPALRRFVPAIQWLDAAVLCVRHFRSSRAGLAVLREASCFGAGELLSAIESARADGDVERERSRLLLRGELLGNAGPIDRGVTVSAAAAISKSPKQAALLAAVVREFGVRQPIELGTNVGISSAYMARATSGTFVTLEASPARGAVARDVHANLGIGNVKYVPGLFQDTLEKTLAEMPAVDFAFIDGHHEYRPTLEYFRQIASCASSKAVFVFDDIRWSEGMWRAWDEIRKDSRFGVVADFWTMGVCVFGSEKTTRIRTPPITCY